MTGRVGWLPDDFHGLYRGIELAVPPVFAIISGGIENTGILWSYIFPILTFCILEGRKGAIAVIIFGLGHRFAEGSIIVASGQTLNSYIVLRLLQNPLAIKQYWILLIHWIRETMTQAYGVF